jgi:hypothetical protein
MPRKTFEPISGGMFGRMFAKLSRGMFGRVLGESSLENVGENVWGNVRGSARASAPGNVREPTWVRENIRSNTPENVLKMSGII